MPAPTVELDRVSVTTELATLTFPGLSVVLFIPQASVSLHFVASRLLPEKSSLNVSAPTATPDAGTSAPGAGVGVGVGAGGGVYVMTAPSDAVKVCDMWAPF